MVDPIYTIIIPHKNTPDLLQRCLDSIPQRDDVQIIVVDDNSDSKVVDFNHFPGSERNDVKCYFTKEGKGAGYARNIGLKHAQSKWILFADADDFFNEGMLSMLDKWKDSDNEIVYFKASSTDSVTGRPSNRHIIINDLMNQYNAGKLSLKEYAKNVVGPCSKLYKYQFIKDNNLFFDETICANDIGFAARSALHLTKIGVLEDVLYNVTTQSHSLTNSSSLVRAIKFMNIRLTNTKHINNLFVQRGYPDLCFDIRKWALEHSLSQKLGFRSFILFTYTAYKLMTLDLHKPQNYNISNKESQVSFISLILNIITTYVSFHFKKILK